MIKNNNPEKKGWRISMKKQTLTLKPVDMTEEIMQRLEEKGLITRLTPGRHRIPVEKHGCEGRSIYESDPKYGGHKLIVVACDRVEFSAFGAHEDNEEFLLIGGEQEKGLYLLVALCMQDEFQEKVESGTLSADDLICLRCRFNDPMVSFFTMKKGVPHGEATPKNDSRAPATFYVTEPTELGLTPCDFGGFSLEIDD